MATEAVENYLKAMYTLARESPTGEAGMKALATMVGVTTGTATTMVKRLAAAKLARYERFGGVRLTTKGEAAAVDILRRHRLIETFLVQTLKLDWAVVHDEAERLEHAISPVVLEALDRHLGHPSSDPHGDPIPSAEGRIREPGGRPLTDFETGQRGRVVRIADQDADFLKFVDASGLRPGAPFEIRSVDAAAQTMSVRARGRDPVALALAAARKIVCERE
ncbi:MAG: metal-dependent transcriptional regulator [Phycisphaerae bacterium]|nr:metal-dependent transcriptional regulator [Phycisphaerae bacterium]